MVYFLACDEGEGQSFAECMCLWKIMTVLFVYEDLGQKVLTLRSTVHKGKYGFAREFLGETTWCYL